MEAWNRIGSVDESAHVDPDELWEAAHTIAQDAGAVLLPGLESSYAAAFGAHVSEYLDPPSDGDFEYFNEDSDD